MRRYGLRDDQWDRIKDFLPGRGPVVFNDDVPALEEAGRAKSLPEPIHMDV